MKRTLKTVLAGALTLLPMLAGAHPGHDHSASLHTELSYPWLSSEHIALLLLLVGCAALLVRGLGRR